MESLFSGEELVSNHINIAVENAYSNKYSLKFVVLFNVKIEYFLNAEWPVVLSQKLVILFFI